jgi:hypothetical protein
VNDLPPGPIIAYNLEGYDFVAPVSQPGVFRGSRILDSQVVSAIHAAELRAVFRDPGSYGDDPMRCFIPRFGITAGSGAEAVDVLICTECLWAYFFRGEIHTEECLSDLGRHRLDELHTRLFPRPLEPARPRRKRR